MVSALNNIDAVLLKLSELPEDDIVAALKSLDAGERDMIELAVRSRRAASRFDVVGFQDAYWCIWGREMPPYSVEWVDDFMGGWTILECFRGSTKSTTLTVTLNLFCLGHEPWASSLVVQANDEAASKTTSLIAGIVEHFKGWRAMFPHIVPDKERGWGANGYFIKDNAAVEKDGYAAWLEMCSREHLKDPSFVGYGVSSGSIVGMHPKYLFIDDIHDRKNSAYANDRRNVVESVQANLMPTLTKPETGENRKPFVGVSCTFWDEDDAYHMLLDTGLFKHRKTPILTFCDDGDEMFDDKPCKLTWPESFPMELVMQYRAAGTFREFARMYLCDLESAKDTMYKWSYFPYKELSYENPMVGGVDYASTWMPTSGREGGRSHFALAYLIKMPGFAIIADGIVEQVSQSEAEGYVTRAQTVYPNWLNCYVESDGVGAQFVQLMLRNPLAKVIPIPASRMYRGSKKERQWNILSPLLERGALRLSDADTKFMRVLKRYLENYPNIEQHAPEWDVADSIVMATAGLPELSKNAATISKNAMNTKEKQRSPWLSLGSNAK